MMWYWQIHSPDIDPHKYSQLTFNKGVKAIQRRKDSFLTTIAGIIEYSHEKSNKTLTLQQNLYYPQKINLNEL